VYDPDGNRWKDLRPLSSPHVSGLRCASWDSDAQVIVLFGGEGNHEGTVVYDPHENTWTRMKPRVEPAFRSAGNMVYDAAHNATYCSVHSSRTIRTRGPMTCEPIGGRI